MPKLRPSPKKTTEEQKVLPPSKPKIKTTRKSPKDDISLKLERGDVALVIKEKDSTLYLPAHYGDDDPVPEYVQLMCAMAILFKTDPTFKKYIKRRWDTILKNLDSDPEYQKEKKATKPNRKITKRRKALCTN